MAINPSRFVGEQGSPSSTAPAKRAKLAGSQVKILKRVINNEKKITHIKNILKLQKSNLKDKLASLDPKDSPMLEVVKGINENVGGILSILTADAKAEEDNADEAKQDKELAGRRKKESKKESGAKGLKVPGFVKKMTAPLGNLWDNIVKTFMLLLAGWGLDKFLNWFSNPANEKIVDDLIEFVTTALPAIIKGILAVIGIGLFTKLAIFTGKIIQGTAMLVKGLWALMKKLAIWAMANPKMAMAVGLGALIGGLAILGSRQKDAGVSGAEDPVDPEELGPTEETTQMAGGGTVPKKKGTDTVPAMLTPGEFVMSKGAVDQYGTDTLEEMNAEGGGDNRPKTYSGGGPVYAKGGGSIGRGSIDVKGSGDGSTGTLRMKDSQGKQVGSSYGVISGSPGSGDVSQKKRRNVSGKMFPMPDGEYGLSGFKEHKAYGGKLAGLGKWSTFIDGEGVGKVGKRTGLMIHNDIDPYGTAGCIGVQLGGKAGSESEKNFLKAYKKVNPDKITVKLGGIGSGGGEDAGADLQVTGDNIGAIKSANALTSGVPGGGGGGSPQVMMDGKQVPAGGGTDDGDSNKEQEMFSSIDDTNLTTLIIKSMYGVVG